MHALLGGFGPQRESAAEVEPTAVSSPGEETGAAQPVTRSVMASDQFLRRGEIIVRVLSGNAGRALVPLAGGVPLRGGPQPRGFSPPTGDATSPRYGARQPVR